MIIECPSLLGLRSRVTFSRKERRERQEGVEKEGNGDVGPFENPWRALRALREK